MRASVAIRAAVDVAVTVLHVVIGITLALAGGAVVVYQMEHPPAQKLFVYIGLGAAALGLLLIPTIFPFVQKIVVFVVPYLPVIGGRRAGDPPKGSP